MISSNRPTGFQRSPIDGNLMRSLTILLLLAAGCAGPRSERPNSGGDELQRMRNDRLGSAPLPSSLERAGQEDWETDRRERATRERAESRAQQCEYDCDARRATCEARCADDPKCLARCPEALSCRANCR